MCGLKLKTDRLRHIADGAGHGAVCHVAERIFSCGAAADCRQGRPRGLHRFTRNTPHVRAAHDLWGLFTPCLALWKSPLPPESASEQAAEMGGATPLLVAASNSHTDVCHMLIDAGANFEAQVPEYSAFLTSPGELSSDPKYLTLLLPLVPVFGRARALSVSTSFAMEQLPTGTTPLIAAVDGGNEHIVAKLLQAGAQADLLVQVRPQCPFVCSGLLIARSLPPPFPGNFPLVILSFLTFSEERGGKEG